MLFFSDKQKKQIKRTADEPAGESEIFDPQESARLTERDVAALAASIKDILARLAAIEAALPPGRHP